MSLLSYPMPVPAGQHPPFAVITPTDHRAWIYVSAAFCVGLTFMSLGIRAIIRYATRVTLGYDDAAVLVSTLLAILQTSLVLAATSKGLGEAFVQLDASERSTLQRLYYASNLFYIFSLCASRASALIFLRRLTPSNVYRRGTDILTGILAVWTLGSLLALALQCNVAAPWYFAKSQCTAGLFTRWVVIEILGAILEVCLIVLTFSTLAWNLQTNIQRKVRIMVAFSVRMLILVAIGVRLKYFNTDAIEQDPTLNIAEFVCLTQAEMNFSIISATAPMLRVVLMGVPTKFGDTVNSSMIRSHGKSGRSSGSKQRGAHGSESGIQLSSLRSFNFRRDKPEPQVQHDDMEPDTEALVPMFNGVTTSTVQKCIDAKSTHSEERIIKKNMTWAVSYDQ